ncbi:MAG: 50S ribosomal protein L25 [Acidobacteria bacterium]|nr:50S ribosomal protein L25 [Acidobacteriota bacterium]
MLEHSQLEVTARAERGKNAARRLRVTGKVPATLYGLGKDPESIALDTRAMVRILNNPSGHNRVFDLQGGAHGHAMAVDWQSDPVTGKLLHIDMKRLDLTTKIRVKVAVETFGVAYGVKTEGGLEDVILREIEVECLPEDIPASIRIDVTELKAGESVRASEIPDGEKYTIASPGALTIMRIVGKRTLEAYADIEEEAAGEAVVEGEEAEKEKEGE